jgi:two-component system sensor histidine kinase KdpD
LCRLLGLPLEAVVSRPVIVVVPGLGRPAGRDALQAALHGGPVHLGSVPTTTADGEAALLSISVVPLGSATAGLMLVALDVTERARLEAELRSRHALAAEARDRLRAVVEVVSHELRTPLTSVLGFAQLLEESPDAPAADRRQWAAVIAEKARLMARLVSEITDLARLGSDRFELHLEATEIPRLVERVALELEAGIEGRPIEVRSVPVPIVLADTDRVEQVVANLITNAMKFSPPDAVVEIDVEPEGDGVQVRVSDRGPGVPERERSRIFEPFYRAAGTSDKVGGSGLGLAVCQGIVTAHGGRIEVSDRAGGGSVFTVWLPTRPQPSRRT